MEDQIQMKVLRWWQSMNLPLDQLKEKGIQPAPTVYRAQLKRSESIDSTMLCEGFRALWLSLPEQITSSSHSAHQIECWACIAAVLAYVKKDDPQKLAQAAGKKREGGDGPIVSELRFAQLQDAKTPEEFLRCLRRTVKQVKGSVSVVKLATDIQQWFSEYHQLRPRPADKRISVQWALDYYRANANQTKSV